MSTNLCKDVVAVNYRHSHARQLPLIHDTLDILVKVASEGVLIRLHRRRLRDGDLRGERCWQNNRGGYQRRYNSPRHLHSLLQQFARSSIVWQGVTGLRGRRC